LATKPLALSIYYQALGNEALSLINLLPGVLKRSLMPCQFIARRLATKPLALLIYYQALGNEALILVNLLPGG
jgi:hypothetical protein